ncbi:hypothetical protein K435DRAFT_795772 [Dendrothele bispora CBS 962.96]|uniref:G-protein coupled receptors family 2 profile 2 domain-containing protein n=1 Tax=Dendrothele bispora (strain CBS 962.96) TaxID=1314807 RepID=A0A4S8M8G7_DENBC|nr:hypothetical protein K435DRAFT_795772 [Dendrothele bispora CBS 962.96]
MTHYLTEHQRNVANYIWMATSAVGAAFCFLILFITFAIWLYPKSRLHLDRVSWRIVVWALMANFILAITGIASTRLPQSSETLCAFSVFVLQMAFQFSGFLFFTISLNLQLVVIHGFSGQKLEKIYIAGSVAIAIILNVPPYAAGKLGWDPLEGHCWYTADSSREDKLVWQIATQIIWVALTAFGEIINSMCVIIWMWRYNTQACNFSDVNLSEADQSNHIYETNSQGSFNSINYRRIFIRISRYPLASCFVNLLSIFTVLRLAMNNDYNNQAIKPFTQHFIKDYNLLLLSDFLYGGRPIVYAALAACDPAFIRGFKTLLGYLLSRCGSGRGPRPDLHDSETKLSPLGFRPAPMANDLPIPNHSASTTVHVEVSRMIHNNESSSVSESKIKYAHDVESSKGTNMKNPRDGNAEDSSVMFTTTIDQKSMDVLDISLPQKSRRSSLLRFFRGSDQERQERQEEDGFWKQV